MIDNYYTPLFILLLCVIGSVIIVLWQYFMRYSIFMFWQWKWRAFIKSVRWCLLCVGIKFLLAIL